ncbi:MAG: hypothetical protein Q9175_007672 [Cornicularia normoerica]
MSEAQCSNPRKRRNSERLTPQQNKTLQHVSKRRKRSRSQPPPAFWDNLSKIDLTRRALKELDRRNTQAALNSRPLYPRSQRPITRRVLAELKKSSQPLTPAAKYFCHCGASGLKNIKQTARHGGPDLSDLRGLPEHSSPPNPATSSTRSSPRVPERKSMATSRTRPSANTTNTASTSPYNRNFQQNLIDGGVYPDRYKYPDGRVSQRPANWEEINQNLAQPRPSLSPSRFSDEDFEEFQQADADASKEKQVTTSVIPIVEGDIGDAKCVSGGIPFTNLDPLTDGTLVPGNPDIYYGARPEQLDRRVRNELRGHIIPSTQDDLPMAPNFFLAAKGPDGSAAVAKRQACYDGALGARGMDSLQSYGQENTSHITNAYTISSIYHDGTLKMYTSHPSPPTNPGSRPEYHMRQLNGWVMTGHIETFRQGATYYRNGRDWAKQQRDEAIRRANERVDEHHAGPLAIDASFRQASTFASEATSDGTYTIEALSEESRTSLTEDTNTTTHVQTPEVSSGEPSVEYRTSVKRSKGSPQSQRKRRNAGDSDYGLSQQSELQPPEPSGLSQQFENQVLGQEPERQSSRDDLQQISSDTSMRMEKPASNKRKA